MVEEAAKHILPPALAAGLRLLGVRLAADPELPWLLGGAVAQLLQGVDLIEIPTQLQLISGAAEVARLATLLNGQAIVPLATQAAPGFKASPRGVYEVQQTEAAGATAGQTLGIQIEVAGDVWAVGPHGELSLALERVWALRVPVAFADSTLALMPPEIELASALLRGDHVLARAIAEHLFAQGARWERLDGALAQVPALEQPLWELMDQVRPMAKRAKGRKIRRETGWGTKK